jgi:hypothetical protein
MSKRLVVVLVAVATAPTSQKTNFDFAVVAAVLNTNDYCSRSL